jgi:hypothetical protein
MVDDEVKRLIDEAYARATEILTANRELLDRMRAALLERETIDREDLDRLVKDAPPAAQPRRIRRRPPSPSAKPGVTPARAPIWERRRPNRRRVNVSPVALHSTRGVRDALRGHGWADGRASDAAGGIHPLALHLTGLSQDALEALVRVGGSLGLEVVTGDDWALLARQPIPPQRLRAPLDRARGARRAAVQVGLALPPDPAGPWLTARGPVSLDGPVLMGILNVTPDSFSDGGRYRGPDAALARRRCCSRREPASWMWAASLPVPAASRTCPPGGAGAGRSRDRRLVRRIPTCRSRSIR